MFFSKAENWVRFYDPPGIYVLGRYLLVLFLFSTVIGE